jgi:hypothetical protein
MNQQEYNKFESIKGKLKEEIKRCNKLITISSLKLNNLEKIKRDIDCSENFFHSNKIKCISKSIFFAISATLLSLLLSLINPTIFASISLLSSLTCFTIIESLVYFNKTKNIKNLVKKTNYDELCREIDKYNNDILNNKKKINIYKTTLNKFNFLYNNINENTRKSFILKEEKEKTLLKK